jgi:site-specific recombinase XerD
MVITTVVNKRLIPKFGHIKVKKLTPKMISSYYNELLKEGLTEEYIQYIHAILKLASHTAVDWKYIKNDFMSNVKAPRSKKNAVETWSIEECIKFLKRMREQQDHVFILYFLAIYTGMRRWRTTWVKVGRHRF